MAAGMCVKTHGAGGVCVCVCCDQTVYVLPLLFCPTLLSSSVDVVLFISFFLHNILKLYMSGSLASPFPEASCLVAADLCGHPLSSKHSSVNIIN